MIRCDCCGGLLPETDDGEFGEIKGQPCECHDSEYLVISAEEINLQAGLPVFGRALRHAMTTKH